MIRDPGVGSLREEYCEESAGQSIYSMGNLFSGNDQFQLERASRDITARTPLGLMRMTVVSIGGTNSVNHLSTAMSCVLNDLFRVLLDHSLITYLFAVVQQLMPMSIICPSIRRFLADCINVIDQVLA
ncbi:MAG: hypothetical protein BJ554DRAFT_14 [Olpidium bornovanus]|uniref:Uncharacterized protein n=1 Tax=Olpidium bornovanus TaxID=278681 RepID=A0A8H7ZUV2_9FUNG|nr:MAG: hypothetical protein BJ554DRAFT_14 [Olpidium bornovanus]